MQRAWACAMLMAISCRLVDGVWAPGDAAVDLVQERSFVQSLDDGFDEVREAIPFCAYINLDARLDRRERVTQEMAKVGLTCTRIPAVLANEARNITAERGCILSHIRALERLLKSDAEYGLILEDDAVWMNEPRVPGTLTKMPFAMQMHNVTLLACHGKGKPSSVGEPWSNIGQCSTTSAYIIRKDYAPTLIKVWEKAVKEDVAFADQSWKPNQQPDGWVMSKPLLIKQGASYSDIAHTDVEYGVKIPNQANVSDDTQL